MAHSTVIYNTRSMGVRGLNIRVVIHKIASESTWTRFSLHLPQEGTCTIIMMRFVGGRGRQVCSRRHLASFCEARKVCCSGMSLCWAFPRQPFTDWKRIEI